MTRTPARRIPLRVGFAFLAAPLLGLPSPAGAPDDVAALRHRASSSRFEVRTDVSQAFARRLLEVAEALHGAFAGDRFDGGFARAERLRRPIRILAFRDAVRFRRHAAATMKGLEGAEGFYDYEQDRVVAHGEDLTAYAHETCHGLMARIWGIGNVLTLPLWLVEGFPDYVSAFPVRDGALGPAEPHLLRLWMLKRGLGAAEKTRLSEDLDATIVTRRGVLDSRIYARSWAVIWYLMHGAGGRWQLALKRAFWTAAAEPARLASFDAWFGVSKTDFEDGFNRFFASMPEPDGAELQRRWPNLFR